MMILKKQKYNNAGCKRTMHQTKKMAIHGGFHKKGGVLLNHQIYFQMFQEINHPAIGVSP